MLPKIKSHLLNFGFDKFGQELKPLVLEAVERDASKSLEIHKLICGHSKFVDMMMDNASKCDLTEVLLELTLKNPSLCKNELVPVLMASYGASLSKTDQCTLHLLALHERQGCHISNLNPFLWGDAAADYYSVRKKIQLTLTRTPSIDQVLKQYNSHMFNNTIRCFPLDIHLDPTAPYSADESLYDPRFVLTSLYALLSPHLLVKCSHFVERFALNFVIAALSCENDQVRSLAYAVLGRFYSHLETDSLYSERQFWMTLIEYFCTENNCANQRLPPLVSSFFTKMLLVFLKPLDILYIFLKDFVCSGPVFKSSALPEMLLKLLEADDPTLRFRYQTWALSVLTTGLRTKEDFQILKESNIFSSLFTLYLSPLTDFNVELGILQVVESTAKLSSALVTLYKEYFLFPWLHLALSLATEKYAEEAYKKARMFKCFDDVVSAIEKASSASGHLSISPTFGEELSIFKERLAAAQKQAAKESSNDDGAVEMDVPPKEMNVHT